MNINKGMYVEEVINRTIEYYNSKNICYIEKRFPPYKIIKKINNINFLGVLISKSSVDYNGIINGIYFDLEVKQTSKNHFDLNMLMKHQFNHLMRIQKLNGKCFIIIFFENNNDFILIDWINLIDLYKTNKNKCLPYEKIKQKGRSIELSYPGILDFIKFII